MEEAFNQWLDEIRPIIPLGDEGISNRERYADIIPLLSIAFEAGFKAYNKIMRLEALQKLTELDEELGWI